ncbi:class I SAM-dependent methyltransferase [Saccharopolyspora sp. K220]|nr:class I SAM-dependent methyltransferase [Saccharopolyspora soli]
MLGRLGGRLMAYGNAATERHVVAVAVPQPGETVLVVGPGPGVGVLAAEAAGHVIAVDPSPVMLAACRRRCAHLTRAGLLRLELYERSVEQTGLPDAVADVVVSVNNIMFWPDRAAGFAELCRVLRPGGRLVLSAHERWLGGGADQLLHETREAGFTDTETWTWQPPTRSAGLAIQLRAARPPAQEPE